MTPFYRPLCFPFESQNGSFPHSLATRAGLEAFASPAHRQPRPPRATAPCAGGEGPRGCGFACGSPCHLSALNLRLPFAAWLGKATRTPHMRAHAHACTHARTPRTHARKHARTHARTQAHTLKLPKEESHLSTGWVFEWRFPRAKRGPFSWGSPPAVIIDPGAACRYVSRESCGVFVGSRPHASPAAPCFNPKDGDRAFCHSAHTRPSMRGESRCFSVRKMQLRSPRGRKNSPRIIYSAA